MQSGIGSVLALSAVGLALAGTAAASLYFVGRRASQPWAAPLIGAAVLASAAALPFAWIAMVGRP